MGISLFVCEHTELYETSQKLLNLILLLGLFSLHQELEQVSLALAPLKL